MDVPNPVEVGPVRIGRGLGLALIAGPCVMEPDDLTRRIAGRLVEIDTIGDLRRLRRTVVEVGYRDAAPQLTGVAGVSDLERLEGRRLRFTLSGPPTQVLRALSSVDVTALRMHEPTLEEIFLDYYGEASR